MKRKICLAASFILLAITVNSCEALDCKICKQVFYYDGDFDHVEKEAEYCGAELIGIQATGTINIGGGMTAKWECR